MAPAEGQQEAVSSRRARVFSWFEGCLVLGAQISVPGTMELCAPTVEFLPEP